jgi:DNA-binding HxlR family transcriptional regulator
MAADTKDANDPQVRDQPHLPEHCPSFQRTIEVLGRRWMGAILRVLMSGPHRFNEILAAVPGLSDPMLTQRLREMEAEGLAVRRVYPTSPVRVEYELTERGRDLEAVIRAIMIWGNKWMEAQPLDE